MQPRLTCGSVSCIILAGTSEGLEGPRVLEGTHCRCCAPGDLAGSILVEILHSGESEDVEQVAQTLKQISCVYDFSYLSQLTCVY